MTPRRIFLWLMVTWTLLIAGFWRFSFPDHRLVIIHTPFAPRALNIGVFKGCLIVHEGPADVHLRWRFQPMNVGTDAMDPEFLASFSYADIPVGGAYSLRLPLWMIWLAVTVAGFVVMRIA